jgi:NADPH-dependent glutamate synthase beta subunit-like oxidoreductase
VWHSSKIRDAKDLLTDGGRRKANAGKRIVVVGGQMSGVEIAGTIAFQISSAVNNPSESAIPDAAKYVVTHVVQQPVWVMPLFFPNDPEIDGDGGHPKVKLFPNSYLSSRLIV